MKAVPPRSDPKLSTVFDWSLMRDSGMLWAINRVLLHPRGYALAFAMDDDEQVTGWTLLGDGTEPWRFAEEIDEDDYFARWESFLEQMPAMIAGFDAFKAAHDGSL